MVFTGWLAAHVPFSLYACPVELVTVAVHAISQHLVPVHLVPLGHVQVELTEPPQPSGWEMTPHVLAGQVGGALGLQVQETVVTQLGQDVHGGAVVGHPPVEGHVLAEVAAAAANTRRRAKREREASAMAGVKLSFGEGWEGFGQG
jgi:hypothetical protein